MRHQGMLALVVGLALTMAALGQNNKAEVLLGTGLHQEEVEGNCKEAIKNYQKAIQERNVPRHIAARAQLHIGACQEKLGNGEARKAYDEVVRTYADQSEIVADANRRLVVLDAAPSKSQIPIQYLGVWNGTGQQPDVNNGQPWTAVISMTGGGVGSIVGTIHYPSHTCGGELTLRSISVESIDLQVKLAWGVPCADNGLITLRLEPNGTLEYRWSHTTNPLRPTAKFRKMLNEAEQPVQLAWFDRTGKEISMVGVAGAYRGVDLSPDGRRLAVHRHEGDGGDIWITELSSGTMSRLTTDADGRQDNSSPIWSPDGSRIVFASNRNGTWGLYAKRTDGAGAEERLFESADQKVPMNWSPDGRFVIYVTADARGPSGARSRQWVLPLTGDRRPFLLLETANSHAQISPDGKWIAYNSDESGEQQVYVKPFPSGPGKWQISTNEAVWPRWRGDSGELYFHESNNSRTMMAAEIRASGSSLQPGAPRPLFVSGYVRLIHKVDPRMPTPGGVYHTYAVSRDGQRFLISRPAPAAGSPR